MRGVVVSGPGRVDLVERDDPTPGPGEVLVFPQFVGICGTDRRLVARGPHQPRVPGHEIAGTLVDGQPVGVHPDVGCESCSHCEEGFNNRCPQRQSIGLDRDGGLATMVAVPARHVMPLEGIPLRLGPLLEPLACCLHAIELLGVDKDESALVVGAGTMGILTMWALQSLGARVAVAQRSAARRHRADSLGADVTVGEGEDPREGLGEPPQVAVVTAPSRQALTYALETVAVGGRVHSFAGMPEGGEVDANLVHYRHLQLVGSTGSRLSDYVRAYELVTAGAIPLGELPQRVVSLEEAPPALLDSAPSEKVVIEVKGKGV